MKSAYLIGGAILGFLIGGFFVGLIAFEVFAFMIILVDYPGTVFMGWTPLLTIPQGFDIFFKSISGTVLVGLIGAAISAGVGALFGAVAE